MGASGGGRLLGLALLFLALSAAGPAARGDWAGKMLPDQPTDFIVGYGTLINTPSRNGTATRPIPAIPVRVLASFGYIRAWNVHRGPFHFTAQGLRKAGPGESGATFNGVLYPAIGGDMASFDRREVAYDRVEVPRSQIETVGWQPLPTTGRIWVYVPKPDNVGAPDAAFPILQSYIDLVVEGGLEYSFDFAREIVETTDGWNRFWLDDRELAHRPWVADPKAQDVDAVLLTAVNTKTLLPSRAFPENWGEVSRTPAAAKP